MPKRQNGMQKQRNKVMLMRKCVLVVCMNMAKVWNKIALKRWNGIRNPQIKIIVVRNGV